MKLYAGDAPASPLPVGCAARIMTGAPLPEGADCVLMQELTDSGEDDGPALCRPEAGGERGVPGRGHRRRDCHRRSGHRPHPGPPRGAGRAGLCRCAGLQNADRGRSGHRQRASGSGRSLDARQNLRRQRHPERRPPAAAGLCAYSGGTARTTRRRSPARCGSCWRSAMPSSPAAASRWGRRTICPLCWNSWMRTSSLQAWPRSPEAPCWPERSAASWCSACPATPLPPPLRWNNTPSRPCCGRQGAVRKAAFFPAPPAP